MDKILVRDDLGVEVVFADLPRRIVSLVPSMTETVIDLGAAERLVGITRYCVHPEEAVASIAKVGGTKGFSFEKIAALKPDLILANKEENRKRHVERLRESYTVFVSYPRSVEESVKMVKDLGALTGTLTEASRFAVRCEQLLDSMDLSVVGTPLRAACMIWRDPWMAAGCDTYVSALLEKIGFVNVFFPYEDRYPETTLQAILERKPDVVILPDEPYAFGAADEDVIRDVVRKRGDAARTMRFDGSLLTWFGTRTFRGLGDLYEAKRKLLAGVS